MALETILEGGGAGPIDTISVTTPLTTTGGANPILGILAASHITAGSMSAADKIKLDGLSATPINSITGTLPITVSAGQTPVVAINAATESLPGSMSAADKTVLDNIYNHQTTAVSTTVTAEGYLVEVTASPGVTITVPTGTRQFSVKDRTNAANPIISVTGQGGVTFEDPNNLGVNASFATTVALKQQGGCVTWRFNGTSYIVVSST